MSEDFLEKYQKFIEWERLSEQQSLSEEFIERYKKHLNWHDVCEYQILSEEFIRKHVNDFDTKCWYNIAGNDKNILSEKFIREFSEFWNWNLIGQDQIINKNMLREFGDKITWHNWNYNMRTHVAMTQEETIEFMPGYEDVIGNVTVMDVTRGNYDKRRKLRDNV